MAGCTECKRLTKRVEDLERRLRIALSARSTLDTLYEESMEAHRAYLLERGNIREAVKELMRLVGDKSC